MLMLLVLIINSFSNIPWVCHLYAEQSSRLCMYSTERDETVPVLKQFMFLRGNTDNRYNKWVNKMILDSVNYYEGNKTRW